MNLRKSIVFFNRSAEAAFGYSADEVHAKPVKLLFRGGLSGFHPDRIAPLEAFRENAAAAERREIVGRRKDGNHVYYRIVDEGVLTLCEDVCGSVQQQLRTLSKLVSGSAR